MTKPSETQVGGGHYKSMMIQPAEYCHKNGLGYMESRAITYLSRWRNKNGVEDLEKAKHCIELLLEFESSPQSDPDGRSDDEPQTRCPYFTGEPPSWDDIDGDWLVQDYDGEFRSYPVRPEPAEECFWWSSNRFALQCEDELGEGPRNPNWKLAIEPRPETHK